MKRSYRLGTTSYILPDEILPNVHYLSRLVDDVELVLFEVDDGQNNLPDAAAIREMNQIASEHSLSYSIHLPLDVKLGNSGSELDVSLQKAKKVIECTQDLNPSAYVVHLDGREFFTPTPPPSRQPWVDQAVRSLEILGEWTGCPEKLSVENLETYPPSFWDEVLERIAVSRCIDVGHLWLDGIDPIPFLTEHLFRTKVIHLHGIHERDHRSLQYMPRQKVEDVFELLKQREYRGICTIEVFNQEDFLSSMELIHSIEG